MYHVINGFIKLIAKLPLPVLYFFSDIIYAILYYVTGYRKNVVMHNLGIAFPDKTERERRRIAKDFYHGLTDTFMETVKFFSWSLSDINKRFTTDVSLMDDLYETGRPIHVLGMHNFNWEFANWGISGKLKVPFYAIYLPVGNRHFDRMMKRMRSRYGTLLVPATDFKNHYAQHRNEPHVLGSAADQSPANPLNAWWVNFFGRRTAFVRGSERGAIAANAAVVFLTFYKTRRGHYKMDLKLFTRDASKLSPGEMTRAYAAYVEDCIRQRPANYLWSHRRWKHQWKEEYDSITIKD